MLKKYYLTTQNLKQRDRVAKLTARNRKIILEAKKGLCSDCRISYPPHVMDLDHVRGEKLFGLGGSSSRAETMIRAEISKCDPVCANCHRERTHKRRALVAEQETCSP